MISVIIVTFNAEQLILNCLSAMNKQTHNCFEIVIVDNGSSDNTLKTIDEFLQKTSVKFPIKIIPLEKNLGFSKGNAEGLSHASGNYIALLNNDTVPHKKWLEELEPGLEIYPSVGACASKLVCYNSNRVDSAGDCFTKILMGHKRGEGMDIASFNIFEHVFGACAGAALYRREMIENIGFLDDDFFLIHEDTDLNFRAQLAGWKVLYVPTAIVYHKVRSSIGSMSDLAVYYSLRNREFVRIKNVPFGVFMKCFPEFILGIISEFLYFAVKHKQFKLFLKAKKDALKMFPQMWKKRKIIMKTRKVNNRYLLGLMTPIWQKDFFKAKLGKFLHG